MPIQKIISGGQTGVDRAALDTAQALGVPCGGWCPRGRPAEDGLIPPRYPLRETPTASYTQRTRWNVRDSDGTLILNRGLLEGGTALTMELAQKLGRPCLVVDLSARPSASAVRAWAAAHQVRVLNVAGPRERRQPGVTRQARAFLRRLLAA